MISKIFGNSIQDSFKSFDFSPKNENHLVGFSASNNGYEKFGCIHKREIYLDKEKLSKRYRHIFKAKDGYPIRYAFRSTLILITVVKTMSEIVL